MTQRTRDLVGGPLSLDYFMRRAADGWTLAAVEWVREIEVPEATAETPAVKINVQPEEIPYGLRIADDGFHLEENPVEKAALLLILEKIVMEKRLSQIAEDLNHRGLRTRHGTAWSSSSIFDLLPRLIEVGPKLLNSSDWRQRRDQLSLARYQA